MYELLVELRATPRTSVSSGFTIHYVSDGEPGELTIPYRVIICANPTDPKCQPS